jgi:flagellar hook-associated protein 3 FlgL
MMRVSTAYSHIATNRLINEAQSRLMATQNEISSGKRATTPGDDPVNASQVATARSSLAAQTSYAANHAFLDGELRLLESTIGSIGDTVSSVRETLVAAGNATYSNTDRATLAASLREMRAQLLALANTRGADGQFMFGGYQSTTIPFFQSGAGVAYAGDNGARGVIVGAGLAIQSNSDGQSLFMDIPRGNGSFATAAGPANAGSGRIDSGTVVDPALLTGLSYAVQFTSSSSFNIVDAATSTLITSGAYTPGSAITLDGMRFTLTGSPSVGDTFQITQGQTASIFASIDQAIAALSTTVVTDGDRARVDDAVRSASASLEQGFNNVLSRRAEIGGRMVALERATDIAAGAKFESATLLSRLQDTDYADAASRFSQQQTGLQAALAAYAQNSRSNLFDYLR